MTTTPPRSGESSDVRPPCRTVAMTGVLSGNSSHCPAIPSTAAALWEPAIPCADVPSTVLATVLPTPHTFSATEPSTDMGATLELSPGLDRSKTPARRTLGVPPRHAWRTVPTTATTTMPTGAIRTPARSPQDQGAIQDNCHARRLTLQCATVYFLQWSPAAPPRFGEKMTTSAISPYMYSAPPCVYKRRRRAPSRAI